MFFFLMENGEIKSRSPSSLVCVWGGGAGGGGWGGGAGGGAGGEEGYVEPRKANHNTNIAVNIETPNSCIQAICN